MYPSLLEIGSIKYNANLAVWKRIKAMIPAWKDMQDGDWEGFVVEPDEVGSNLEPFLKGMTEHWDACVADGWPLWFVLENDLTDAIVTLQTMLTAMQKIAPPQMQCGVASRYEAPIDDAAWDPVWNAFALRHAVRSGELTADCSVIDLDAFEAFIESARIDPETAYALADDVPHVAGWVNADYQFWVWDLRDIDKIVVIEDHPYCGYYCLPPLREWPNFCERRSRCSTNPL